jgi:hypothetical protein
VEKVVIVTGISSGPSEEQDHGIDSEIKVLLPFHLAKSDVIVL